MNPRPRKSRHWGAIDDELRFDARRFAVYTRAHHVAGHQWALWRLGERLGPVGLSLAIGELDPVSWVEVEASALLVEALAYRYLLDPRHRDPFTVESADFDWKSVRTYVGDIRPHAVSRGCRRSQDEVAQLLGDEWWMRHTGWYALRDWDELQSLADVLGRNRVLESDQVVALLRWWE